MKPFAETDRLAVVIQNRELLHTVRFNRGPFIHLRQFMDWTAS